MPDMIPRLFPERKAVDPEKDKDLSAAQAIGIGLLTLRAALERVALTDPIVKYRVTKFGIKLVAGVPGIGAAVFNDGHDSNRHDLTVAGFAQQEGIRVFPGDPNAPRGPMQYPVPVAPAPVAPAAASVPTETPTGQPSPLDPFGRPVAQANIDPNAIDNPNSNAIRNRRAARGINRELVSERADP